jgi:Trk K+ transport system NAD-binding subunit
MRLFFQILHHVRRRMPVILGVAAVATILISTLAFTREARADGTVMRWHEALYSSLSMFTMSASRLGYPHTTLLEVMYFIAPGISSFAILGAFLHVLEERAPLIGFRQHTVIGGLGTLGTTISRHMTRHRQPFIGIERLPDAPEALWLRSSGHGAVVIGDMTDADVLKRARVHRAQSVFLTSPSDVVNLDAAFHVRRLAHVAGGRRPPRIYAHVYDGQLSESLREQLHVKQQAPIIPFNSYRFAARSLFATLVRDRIVPSMRIAPGVALVRTKGPDERAVEEGDMLAEDRRRLAAAFELGPDTGHSATGGDDDLRYVVVGLGRFGRSLIRELLDFAPPAAKFLVVERSAESYEASSAMFTDEERARFETIFGDATSPRQIGLVERFKPDAVLVCTDNDIANLRLSLDLHRRDVRTVTRMFDIEASRELGRGLHEKGISPVGLARLFPAAIPILTHERQILGVVNLHFGEEHGHVERHHRHLFYLARVTDDDRRRIGQACVPLTELPGADAVTPPSDLALVWYEAVRELELD